MPTYDKEKMREYMRDQRKKRKARGLCMSCGTYKAVEGRFNCDNCLNRFKRNYRERKEAVDKVV